MKNKKGFFTKIKRPRGVMLALVYIATGLFIAAAIVLTVFGTLNKVLAIVSYGVYGIAAVLLTYTIYTIVVYAPHIRTKAAELLRRNVLTANLLDNYGFRTMFFAICSFVITVAFATMNLVSAIRYRLFWYGAIAGYYFMLVFFRGGVMIADSKGKKKFADCPEEYARRKWKIYLASGAFLVPVEIAMAVAITQMMLTGRPMHGGQVMAISNAAYTFWKMAMAIYNLCKARRFDDPVIQALRNLNFADACMSVVSLTVLMMATFGAGAAETPTLTAVKACVGFAACAAIMVLAALTIVRAHKRLRTWQGEENYGQE